MKRVISAGLLFLLLACSRLEVDSSYNAKTELTFTAYREGFEEATKTERGEVNSSGVAPVYWLPGDAVSLFFNSGAKGGNKFIAQNQTKAEKVEFKGTIDSFAGGGEGSANGYYFWAVYPYSDDVSCDGETVTLSLPATQMGKVGSFDNGLFPTVAKAKGLELGFYNIARGIKFTVAGKDKNGTERSIRKVKFKGNSSEKLAGKVKVGWDTNGYPEVRENLEEVYEVSVSAPNGGTFIPGEEYFIVFLPGVFENGFSLTFITDDGKQGTYNYPNKFSFDRGWFGRLRGLDGYISEWTESDDPTTDTPEYTEGGTDSGVYLGIIGFNTELYPFAIRKLTPDTVSECNTFIDGLSNIPRQTLLLWTAEQGVSTIESTTFPSDLFNASIITFTDGFDDGSVGKKRRIDGISYSDEEYYSVIHEMISSSSVAGIPTSAYAIGLGGKDANTNSAAGKQYFEETLGYLSSSNDNRYYAEDMNEVDAAFSEIAEKISKTINLTLIDISFSEPGRNERIRLTFDLSDSQTDANKSKLYIEGVFDPSSMSLKEIQYVGMQSSQSSVTAKEIIGENGEPMLQFSFDGIVVPDNSVFDDTHFRRWKYIESLSYWNPRSETYSDTGCKIRRDFKSAAVLLLLDCSYSLGSDFQVLKQKAESFIEKLYDSSIDKLAVASVSLNRESISMIKGETFKLTETVYPDTAADKTVVWTSSNPSVATVDNSGLVTAISAGTTDIYVTTNDGGKKSRCNVTVIQEATDISISESEVEIYAGDTYGLKAVILPTNATIDEVEWSSNDSSIATVDNSGVVKALKAGTVEIVAKTTDRTNLSASCSVSVKQHVTGVSLDNPQVKIGIGESRSLTYKVFPSNAADKSVSWTSSDASVVLIDEHGEVTGLKEGKSTITLQSSDGGFTSSCEVTVILKVTGISLNLSSLEMNISDDPQHLTATVTPSDATDKTIEWVSADPSIASVSSDGDVTAIKAGETTIIAKAKDGSGVTGECVIRVNQSVTSVTMQFPIWTLQIGSSTTLIATVKPDNATDKSLIWSSSNPDVVDVSAGGVITGMNVGTATVTAFSADGEHSATCEVTVTYSTTPQHLALAVQKNGSSTKYYLTSQQYGTADLTDYTKLGVCVKSTVSFIVKLFDSTTATAQANTSRGSSISVGAPIIYNNEYTATGTTANTGKTMPNLDQAKWICNNMPELNTALTSFGGSAMSTTANYWTSYYRGGNKYYYYKYNLEPTLDGGGTMKCRMREVTSL